jgi:hypothetical protein
MLFANWDAEDQLQTSSFMGMPASQIGGNTLHNGNEAAGLLAAQDYADHR